MNIKKQHFLNFPLGKIKQILVCLLVLVLVTPIFATQTFAKDSRCEQYEKRLNRYEEGVDKYCSGKDYNQRRCASYKRIVARYQDIINKNCKPTPVCTDSDGGKDYYVKGYLKNNIGDFEDYCLNPTILIERFCSDDPNKFTQDYECPNGCQDGACVKQTIQDPAIEDVYLTRRADPVREGGDIISFRMKIGNKGGETTSLPLGKYVSCDPTDEYPSGFRAFSAVQEVVEPGETIDSVFHGAYIIKTGKSLNVECSFNLTSNTPELTTSNNKITKVMQSFPCTDSDGGRNYYEKGITRGLYQLDIIEHTDHCPGGKDVAEAYCEGDRIQYERYECPNGCQDGACIECEEGWQCINDYEAVYYNKDCTTEPEHRTCEEGWICKDGACIDEREELSISGEYPTGVYEVTGLPALVKISFNTHGGADNGKATCFYTFGNESKQMEYTGGTGHAQKLTVSEEVGYIINVKCVDSEGNQAHSAVSFEVEVSKKCIDTDGGKNYYVAGNCVDYVGVYEDECNSVESVIEYYCGINNRCEGVEKICPNGCQDGACIARQQSQILFAVGDNAPVSDVILISDLAMTLQQEGYELPATKLFSEVDATKDLDYTELTVAVYLGEAVVIDGSAVPYEVQLYEHIVNYLNNNDIEYRIIQSEEIDSPNLIDLFDQPECKMNSDCPNEAYDHCKDQDTRCTTITQYGCQEGQCVAVGGGESCQECEYGCQDGTCVEELKEDDVWLVGTSANKLEMTENTDYFNGESIGDIKTPIGEKELQNTLNDGSVINKFGKTPYNQHINFDDSAHQGGYVKFMENEDDTSTDFLYFKSGEQIARYGLEFQNSFKSGIDGENLEDYEEKNIEVLGKTYKIVDAERIAANKVALTLLSGSVKDTLMEGQTKTYSIEGKDYEVIVTAITDTGNPYVKFNINGEAVRSLQKGEITSLVDGIQLAVVDIIPSESGDLTDDLVEFYLGAQMLYLKDSNIADASSSSPLYVNSENIDDVKVIITGSDDNSIVSIDTIQLDMKADDDYYVPTGYKLTEHMDEPQAFLASWDIKYKGLENIETETTRIKTSGSDQYKLEFTDGNGNQAAIPIMYTDKSNNLRFGDNNDDLVLKGSMKIQKNDYLVVSDYSQEDGKRKTYALRYKGADKLAPGEKAIVKFDELGTGKRIEETYDPSTGATLHLGGASFKVINASYAGQDDFEVWVDLDADGSIKNDDDIVAINTNAGMKIELKESTDYVLATFSTPNDEDYGNVDPTPVPLKLSASNGEVQFDEAENSAIAWVSPSEEQNIRYAYTSMGAKFKWEDPAGEPDLLTIGYPKKQRLPLVYIVGNDHQEDPCSSHQLSISEVFNKDGKIAVKYKSVGIADNVKAELIISPEIPDEPEEPIEESTEPIEEPVEPTPPKGGGGGSGGGVGVISCPITMGSCGGGPGDVVSCIVYTECSYPEYKPGTQYTLKLTDKDCPGVYDKEEIKPIPPIVPDFHIYFSGNDQAKLIFKNNDNNLATVPLFYSDGANLKLGDNNDDLITKEGITTNKNDYIILTAEGKSSYALRYKGADKLVPGEEALVKFDELGTGNRIEAIYDPSAGATLHLGGRSFKVVNASATHSDDFDVLVDLNADGSISDNNVNIITYGKEVLTIG